jgi:N-acetylglutamate synthase-like GNAT family acetyltransferase
LAEKGNMHQIRLAKTRDRSFLVALARQYPTAVGFLPQLAVETLIDWRSGWISTENGQHAGYILTRPQLATNPQVRPILQTAVDMSAQRRQHATSLLDAVIRDALANKIVALQAWCRSELLANEFWAAMDFRRVATRPGGKHLGGTLNLWVRQIAPIPVEALVLRRNDRPRGPGGQIARTPCIVTPVNPIYGQTPIDPASLVA